MESVFKIKYKKLYRMTFSTVNKVASEEGESELQYPGTCFWVEVNKRWFHPAVTTAGQGRDLSALMWFSSSSDRRRTGASENAAPTRLQHRGPPDLPESQLVCFCCRAKNCHSLENSGFFSTLWPLAKGSKK